MKSVLKRFFNYLYQKKLFGVLIIGFAVTTIVTWFYLKDANKTNLDYRLEREFTHITTALNLNLSNYANTLNYIQSYFRTEGLPDEKSFERLAESMERHQINDGVQGIGYMSIVRDYELKKYIEANKNRKYFNSAFLSPGQKIYAPITMIAPMTETRQKRIGWDMMSEPTRREAIYSALQTATLTLSKPVDRSVIPTEYRTNSTALLLMLADYSSIEAPASTEDRIELARGVLYIPLIMHDFFEAILGEPSSNERVNFKIMYVDPETKIEIPLYQRFEVSPHEESLLSRTQLINVIGQTWKIEVTALPSFFNFGDRYISNIVVIAFILFIILLYSIFKQTQSLLNHETKAKQFMQMTIVQSHEHAAKLKRLNIINNQTNLDADWRSIVKDFFNASIPVSHSSHAFLFFGLTIDNPEFISFCDAEGFQINDLNIQNRSLIQLNQLIDIEKNIILKNDAKSQEIFSHFIKSPDDFYDWIMIVIPSREYRRCGLLFLGRKNAPSYSDVDIEIIESMVTQFGVRVDNSKLFKKVEDANKVKTAFLSNMSHEIRTPLNAITGFSEILEQTQSPEEKHRLIEAIKKNATLLTSIIDNILDISKIEFGRIFINKKTVSVSKLIESLKSDMELHAQEKGLKFNLEIKGSIPSYIQTDESRVRQILLNLLGNAIKFTEAGSVTLQICYESAASDSYLVFSIIDTGIGISLQEQSKLFQSFTQVEISNTRNFGGLGLGLALSKRLAQQFGGEVSLIDSQPGKGSTFQLKVPSGSMENVAWISRLNETHENPKPTVLQPHSLQLKNKKILIVEDSADNQEIFKYFLTSAGAVPVVTDNGEDAVIKAQQNNYDLILMDIQLPKMDGLEATRRIRAHGYEKPIIALTAHASAEEKIVCLKAGCVDLITKPVTQNLLISRIQTIIKEMDHVRH